MISFISNAQAISDRIQRGCGGLGGSLVQVLTDFSGNVLITTCTGKGVYINGVLVVPGGGVTGSGTAGTIPLWSTSTALGNSILTQTGTSAVTLGAGAFNFTQVVAPTISAANFAKGYFDSTSKTLKWSFNGGGYFDMARANYTTGTVPLGGAGGLLGDSYATQSGNNFSITNPAGGTFVAGASNAIVRARSGTGVTAIGDVLGVGGGNTVTVDDNAGTVTAQATIVNAGNNAGNAELKLNATTGVSRIGDVDGNNNGTIGRFDDAANAITLTGSAANMLFIDGGQGVGTPQVSLGDVNGNANGTAIKIFDNLATIEALAPGGLFTTNAGTFRLDTAGYKNCVSLGTDVSGNLVCTVSDLGLKENLSPFTRGLDSLLGLRPTFWTFTKGRYYHEGQRYAGFLAQDIKKAIPEAVSMTGDGYMQINPAAMQAVTVNAIRELNAKIEAQNKQIAAMQAQINQLLARK